MECHGVSNFTSVHLNFQTVHCRLLLPLDCLTFPIWMPQERGFLVTMDSLNFQSHNFNKDDATKQLCMLTLTFKEESLQVGFWPLIHTFRKSSSCCYFWKWFLGNRSFNLLFVLFCCLAKILAWLLKSHQSELQWNRGPACGQRGTGCRDPGPLQSGMSVLRSLGQVRTLGCCCTTCWLLIPCLLQRWSSSLQEDGDFNGANLWD